MPKVSVIVPVYNVERYLDRCLQSLLHQTLKDIEIIMVDDGSPDNCPRICDEYAAKDRRVKVIHKINEGLGYARNSGLDVATGEYVAFVDSDDYTSEDAYEVLYKKAQETKADIVYAGVIHQHKNGSVEDCFMLDHIFEGRDDMKIFLGNMIYDNKPQKDTVWMSTCTGIYSRDLITNTGIRFLSEREYLSEDLVFHAELIPLCRKIVCIPKPFYHYCYNGSSLSRKFNIGKINSNFKLYEKLTNIIEQYNLDDLQWRVSLFCVGYTRGIVLRGIIMSDMKLKEKRNACMAVYRYDKWSDIEESLKGKRLPFFDRIGLFIIRHKAFYLNMIMYYIYYTLFKRE